MNNTRSSLSPLPSPTASTSTPFPPSDAARPDAPYSKPRPEPRGGELRWLPAGDERSLPRLDAEVAGRNAAGEDLEVVYSARGDRFLIAPRRRDAA